MTRTYLEVRQLVQCHPVSMAGLYEGGQRVGNLQIQVDGVTLPDVLEDDLGVL